MQGTFKMFLFDLLSDPNEENNLYEEKGPPIIRVKVNILSVFLYPFYLRSCKLVFGITIFHGWPVCLPVVFTL